MFGHDSLPSVVYEYGGKGPVEGMELIDDQMRKAHEYRNHLVERELKRRKEIETALMRFSTELAALEKKIAEEEKKREEMRQVLRSARAFVRSRIGGEDLGVLIEDSTKRLKRMYRERKRLRNQAFRSDKWKKIQEAIEERDREERKKLRAKSGLYWGTYLHVEQSCSGFRRGAPPRFHRWDGSGHLAVQIIHGMSVERAFSGEDNRLRIEPVPPEAWQPGGRHLRKTFVWFRVGSDEKGGPIFAKIHIVLHRPLPQDASIKWVHLIRRRIGCSHDWRVQFVLSRAEGWTKKDASGSGSVDISPCWSMMPDGSLRVVRWNGSDGETGELVLPADWLLEMRRVELIRSVRDKNFDSARALAGRWIAEHKGVKDWLDQAGETIGAWKSQARLAALVLRWGDDRIPGDDDIYRALEDWRKRDKHLYEFEANLRDQLLQRRLDLYRNFAAFLRRRYGTARIPDWDLRNFHELPNPEDPSVNGALKEHVRDACLSRLFQAIKCSVRSVELVNKRKEASCTA